MSWGIPIQKGRGCSSYLLGLKKAGLVPLQVHSGVLAIPFRVLSPKQAMSFNVMFDNWYLIGVKDISSHAHKTGCWYLLGVLFKISDEHSRPFVWEFPPGVIHVM